jgi:hypothetical protein
MSGFYILAVPEFAGLLESARKNVKCHVHGRSGNYYYVEFEGPVEILRSSTGFGEAVWYGCLTGGLEGKVTRFDDTVLALSPE